MYKQQVALPTEGSNPVDHIIEKFGWEQCHMQTLCLLKWVNRKSFYLD